MSNPWIIDEADFYEIESHDEQMQFLLRYAILAPSGHNTQPWSFHITPEGVQVFADTSRRLLVVDRNDRELLMSIGAAITNFRVAAAHFGFETTVAYEPRSMESLPVATIFVRETCGPDEQLAALFPAIRRRHTNREPYDEQPLDPETLQRVCDVIDGSSETLRLILPRDTERVAEFVARAEKALLARPAYCAELSDWVGSGLGTLHPKRDAELTRSASLLLVATADEDQIPLVKAGETLELLLLTITLAGLQYSILSAPVEVDETRESLRLLAGSTREPQLLLRIGLAATHVQPTQRRPLESVIV